MTKYITFFLLSTLVLSFTFGCSLSEQQENNEPGNETSSRALYDLLIATDGEDVITHDLMGYRELNDDEINSVSFPSLGDVEAVSTETERKAISENHPAINSWSDLEPDLELFTVQMIEIVKNNSIDNLIDTTESVNLDLFNTVSYNKIKFTEEAIYLTLKTAADENGRYTKVDTVYTLNSNNEILRHDSMYMHTFYNGEDLMYIYFTTASQINSSDGISNTVTQMGELYDTESMTYYIVNGAGRSFTDGDITMTASYDDELDQSFNIYTPDGKLETRSNVYQSDDVDRTSVHTDYYNANNELIALATNQSSDAELALSSNNTFGTYVKNGEVQVSLKEALPLKTEISTDYDLISIVTNEFIYGDQTEIDKKYYLYKKEIDGVLRSDIPSYNGIDYIYDYIDSFIDPVNDIQLDTYLETLYDSNGYFTYVRDLNYFDGPAIGTIDSLKNTYDSMYTQHWMDFRNYSPDYSLLDLSDSHLNNLSSIEE